MIVPSGWRSVRAVVVVQEDGVGEMRGRVLLKSSFSAMQGGEYYAVLQAGVPVPESVWSDSEVRALNASVRFEDEKGELLLFDEGGEGPAPALASEFFFRAFEDKSGLSLETGDEYWLRTGRTADWLPTEIERPVPWLKSRVTDPAPSDGVGMLGL